MPQNLKSRYLRELQSYLSSCCTRVVAGNPQASPPEVLRLSDAVYCKARQQPDLFWGQVLAEHGPRATGAQIAALVLAC